MCAKESKMGLLNELCAKCGRACVNSELCVSCAVTQEREACATYCLDRADQYPTESPIWVGMADCAEGIANGEAAESFRVGETTDLLDRVRRLAGSPTLVRKFVARPTLPRAKKARSSRSKV